MAARALTLVQRWWREGDGFDRYMAVGGAVGSVTGLVVGVAAVLDNKQAGEAAAMGLLMGSITWPFWPVAVLWGVLYVPLKVIEKATHRGR